MITNDFYMLSTKDGKTLMVDYIDEWFVELKGECKVIISGDNMYLTEDYKLSKEKYVWSAEIVDRNTIILKSNGKDIKWTLNRVLGKMSQNLSNVKLKRKNNGLLLKIKGALKNFF